MLKSLQLAGFKSFAEKTRLEFPAGVTVVVGPNGSGKSNVVDAVKWVLGSQSPRSLRGKEMTDVIFGGAGERAPLNSAEVTLAFDNPESPEAGRRLIPLDEAEVRLTRRVYRSGEGEYLINGRGCRLKDFRELLAGTGLGTGAYSIIEQGRVDAALQASPLERRVLFEEAAGVSRYRLKKREAEKRLERVEQNLARLSDLVDELEGRLRRVRAQAGKARRHREQTKRLREVRVALAVADYLRLAEEGRRLEQEHGAIQRRLGETQAAAEAQGAELKRLGDAAQASDTRRLASERVAAQRELVGRLSARLESVAGERRRAEVAVERAVAACLEASDRRAKEAFESQQRERSAALVKAEASLAESQAKADRFDTRRTRIDALIAGVAQKVAAAHRRVADLETRVAQREQDQHRLGQARQTARDNHQRVAQELSQLSNADQGALDEAIAARNAATESLATIETEVREARAAAAAGREHLLGLQQRLAGIETEVADARRRREQALGEAHRMRRLADDVAKVCQTAGDVQVVGLVADLLHVDVDLAPMVEAALGAAIQDVVVDSLDGLSTTYEREPSSLTLRSRFHGLSAEPPTAAIDHLELYDRPGVMGRASDFVEVAPEHEPVVRKLLGRVWFVDSLSTAMRLRRAIGTGVSFVTNTLEVVGGVGELTLGPPDDAHLAFMRDKQIADSEQRVAAAEQAREELAEQIERISNAVAEADAAIAERDPSLSRERDALSRALQRAAALEERVKQQAQRRTELEGSLAQCERQIAAVEKAFIELPDAETVGESLARERRSLSRLQRWSSSLESLRAAELALSAEATASAGKYASLVGSLRQAHKEAELHVGALTNDADEVALGEARVELQRAELGWLRTSADLALATWRLEAATAESRLAERVETATRAALTEVENARRLVQDEAAQLTQRLSPLELRRQQIRMERAAQSERLREDYDLELATLADAADPAEVGAIDRPALQEEAKTLRANLGRSGPVNLAALEELDELETRFEQLSDQYRDLSTAKTSLVRLTTRINNDTRAVYVECFEIIRQHFGELFGELFGGGVADLVMTDDSDDPLESGVEIVASPPGKSMRSLSLLSGGEKTLTCVALLLAMFRTKPGPFCILDEVDAALDESNIDRFAGVLRRFMDSTQFVVITHSKRTMAAADTLYGVTMQEAGVSKQVSVRFEDVDEEGNLRASGGGTTLRRAA